MDAPAHSTAAVHSLARPGCVPAVTARPARVTSPLTAYPSPDTAYCTPGVQMRFTVILFWVMVPVLSVHITLAQPSVSTACRRRMTAPRRKMRPTLSASVMVTMAGSPSGMAATASETPVSSISSKSPPCRKPSRPTARQITTQAAATKRPSCFSFSCRGVRPSLASSIMPAILPISVAMPVAVTTASALPAVTMQPMNTVSPAFLPAGTLSPVSMASLHCNAAALCSFASAAILSPASNSSTSPGTTVRALTVFSAPSRRTRAVGALSSFSASSVCSVRYSCKKPITAFKSTMAMMVTASAPCPISMLMSVAAARIRIITSLNCEKNMAATLACLFAARRFSPTCDRRAAACALVSPCVFISHSPFPGLPPARCPGASAWRAAAPGFVWPIYMWQSGGACLRPAALPGVKQRFCKKYSKFYKRNEDKGARMSYHK